MSEKVGLIPFALHTSHTLERDASYFSLFFKYEVDVLGDMFMECVSHGNNVQFFTPIHVADLMACMGENLSLIHI